MCIVLTGAGITDLRNGKVYNWWLVFGLAAGILCRGTCIFSRSRFFSDTILFAVLFPHDWGGRWKTGSCYRRVSGHSGRLVCSDDRTFSGALWSAGRMWKDRSFGLRMGYLFRYAESLMGQKTRLSYVELKGLEPGTGFLWRHVCQPGDISICLERLQSDLEDMFYETDYGGV